MLAKKKKKRFSCLEENTEKYVTFTVPKGKEVTRIDKSGEKNTKIIPYILQFTDSAKFMASLSSVFVHNLSGGIHEIKYKPRHNDKKCETCGITYEVFKCFLEYANFKDDLVEYKYLCCNKSYQKNFDEQLNEDF